MQRMTFAWRKDDIESLQGGQRFGKQPFPADLFDRRLGTIKVHDAKPPLRQSDSGR